MVKMVQLALRVIPDNLAHQDQLEKLAHKARKDLEDSLECQVMLGHQERTGLMVHPENEDPPERQEILDRWV